MKYIIGVLAIAAGLALGVYVGVWVFLIGGIVNIVHGAQASPANANQIAWGVVEVCILAELCGGLIAWAFGFVAFLCFGVSRPSRGGLTNRQVERNWDRISRL